MNKYIKKQTSVTIDRKNGRLLGYDFFQTVS